MKLHFDAFAGVSGDMTLGALLDLGPTVEEIRRRLDRLPVDGYRLTARTRQVGAIQATDVKVELDDPSGGRHHRNLETIVDILCGADLPDRAVDRAARIFRRLAEAEARVHGLPVDEVHFHEVGAVDAIVDIAGTALAMELLDVDEVSAGSLPMGRGMVQTQHGPIPLPAPATLELLRGAPVEDAGIDGELVTPTGAAIVTTLAASFTRFPAMTVDSVGYGAGDRELPDRPNLLRLVLGQPEMDVPAMDAVQLETNLDDLSPELCGHLLERLLEAGAMDVWFCPVLMKKGRPAHLMGALCRASDLERIGDILFQESSTFGFRWFPVGRRALDRRVETVETPYGVVSVKLGRQGGSLVTASPEYDSCLQAAQRCSVPLKEVFAAAVQGIRRRSW